MFSFRWLWRSGPQQRAPLTERLGYDARCSAVIAHPYLRPWLDRRQLDPIALDVARVRARLSAARKHHERAMAIRAAIPDDHAFHLEKGYDAIRAAAGGLVHAHGVRLKGFGRTHELALDIAVACLSVRRPDAGAALAQRAGALRVRRNRSQYELIELVTTEECEDLFSVLTPIMEALESVAYELIGLPAPGGWRAAT